MMGPILCMNFEKKHRKKDLGKKGLKYQVIK